MGTDHPAIAARVRRAFVAACELDVVTRKPGNVSVASPGHGMDAALFVASAHAAAAPLSEPAAPVGRRIEGAVAASWAAARCNTNLGIVLLCAPLAAATEHWAAATGDAGLHRALAGVLAALDLDDARGAFRAIARANPGGLGRVESEDVACAPGVDLRAAMALAAGRDRIAHQYVSDYRDVFDTGLPALRAALDAGRGARAAMQGTYLEFLAALPDSHIVRKHGAAVAQCVMAEAVPWLARARAGEPLDTDPAFEAWDEALKRRGLNPGTSADLSVVTAMAAALLDGPIDPRVNP